MGAGFDFAVAATCRVGAGAAREKCCTRPGKATGYLGNASDSALTMASILASSSSPLRRAKLAVTFSSTALTDAVNHHRHISLPGHLVVLRAGADAEGHALQCFLRGHVAEPFVQTVGVVEEDDVGARGAGGLAGGHVHALVDLLDQTGQGVARLTDEDQSDEVVPGVSDRAQALAGTGAGHELRDKPSAADSRPRPGGRIAAGLRPAPGRRAGRRPERHWR